MASNLPFGSGVVVIVSVTGSPDPRQRPFGPGHPARYPASYPGRPAEGPAIMSRFPAAFRPPAFASRVILFPPGELGLPHGRLTGHHLRAGPRRGFHVPHERDTTGVGALSTPGTAVLSPAGCRARPAPAASQRPVPAPRCHIPPAGLTMTRHQRGFTRFTRPVFPSPVAPGWNGTLGLSPGFAPRRYQRRTPGRGQAVSTGPELRDRHHRPSNPRVHSQRATSCRNGN